MRLHLSQLSSGRGVGNWQYMEATGHNTDVNARRCAGGFVRLCGRCCGAVEIAA